MVSLSLAAGLLSVLVPVPSAPVFSTHPSLVPSAPRASSGQAEAVRNLTHAELSAELGRIAAEHPDIAELHRIGTSREGRAIEALRLTAADDPSAHPALLLIGNLEGPRIFESGVVLHHARRMAVGHAGDAALQELLASTVVWFVPRANPDAAEGRFADVAFERWAASGGVDNDRDRREGEDPPSDVNGDGVITSMRVLDPDGEWISDPTDARVLIKADPKKGERGMWSLYTEGRDLDGDEAYAEDAPGDTRVDRNFASGWEAHSAHAGRFPTDEPEVHALCEFVMGQRNLVLVVTYDGQDNLVEKPASVADDARPVLRIPKEGVLQSDADLIVELGKRYREATENGAKGSGRDAGTFGRWCYDHRGLYVLRAVLWNLPDEAPKPEPDTVEPDTGAAADDADGDAEMEDGDQELDASDEAEAAPADDTAPDGAGEQDKKKKDEPKPSDDAGHLKWIDGAGEAWRFVDWMPFDHPELGAVEIGGFAPYARLDPPRDERLAIADTHFAWFAGLGELLPRVELSECTREAVGEGGEGVWKVTAVVTNDGYLPVLSFSMRRTRTTRPVRVRLELPEAATLLSGEGQQLISDLEGSGDRHELTWLVTGPAAMELGVSIDTDHAGAAQRTAEVKQ